MPDTQVSQPPSNEEVIKQQALTVVERAKVARIVDQLTYNDACSLLNDSIKPLRKRWKKYWYGGGDALGPIPLARNAYESLLAKFNHDDKPLADAEAQVKAEIARFDTEQERKRQENQAAAEKRAREDAEEEQLRIAAMAEDSGASSEDVNAIVDTPVVIVAPPVPATYQKASGTSIRENWKARVTDIKRLCAAVAKGTVPVTYIEPNMTALNMRAKADKKTLNIPGVVPYNDPVVAGRSR